MGHLGAWCVLSNKEHIAIGDFYQSELMVRSGVQLHVESQFMDHLAELIMQRYEGLPGRPDVTLPNPLQTNPRRTRSHYRRLFDENMKVTQDFITWASETLSLWIELSMATTLYAEGGIPHGTDPAFDVIVIAKDSLEGPRLRLVQVKATQDNLQAQANEAITKFARLENGEFDAEISARLELIERRRNAPAGVNVAELMFDPEKRYRVTVIHGEDHRTMNILTTFATKIPGASKRRSSHSIRAVWPELWDELGRRVLVQLT